MAQIERSRSRSQVLDELAEKLGIDPLDLRRINGSQEGTAQPAGPKFLRIGCLETIEAAKSSEHYKSPLPKPDGKPVGQRGQSGG